MRRTSRAESKARTRAALLDAAERTVARKGYAGAGVEEIAAAAGYSVGALYSNFRNKEELLLALVADRATEQIATAAKLLADGSTDVAGPADPMEALSRQLVEIADSDDRTLLQSEVWAYAVRHPPVRERLAEHLRGPRDALAGLVADERARGDERWPADDTEIAVVVLALFQGLVRQRRLDPAAVPDDLYGRALTWLFDGLDRAAAHTPPSPEEDEP